jgi:ABC-type proline/glycine betaine transport system permease subunit
MNRFFQIATNLASVLGLILGFALVLSTEAREFVLRHGSILVAMVFPLAFLIMLLQNFSDDGRDSDTAQTPTSKR